MDIAEKRLGRTRHHVRDGEEVDIRIASLPTVCENIASPAEVSMSSISLQDPAWDERAQTFRSAIRRRTGRC